MKQNTAKNAQNGFFLFGGDMNSRFDFNPKPELVDESYSIAPPSYIKIVAKKQKKNKKAKKKRKVTRQHLTAADLMVFGN